MQRPADVPQDLRSRQETPQPVGAACAWGGAARNAPHQGPALSPVTQGVWCPGCVRVPGEAVQALPGKAAGRLPPGHTVVQLLRPREQDTGELSVRVTLQRDEALVPTGQWSSPTPARARGALRGPAWLWAPSAAGDLEVKDSFPCP